jgi:hypothetical protein
VPEITSAPVEVEVEGILEEDDRTPLMFVVPSVVVPTVEVKPFPAVKAAVN